MKKIIAIFLTVITIFVAMLSLTACAKGDGAPDGMQLIKGSDALGYYFYGPEEWEVANQKDIATCYVSTVDNSSITFVKAEKPDSDILTYFNEQKEQFTFPIEINVLGEKISFGNYDNNAYKFVYTYKYKEKEHRCMQIFVTQGEEFFIFTYTSLNSKRNEEKTHFDYYLDKVNKVIENFKFVEKSGEVEDSVPNYEVDSDGFMLVSDRTLCGLNFYVPKEYSVDFASAIISVTRDDGTNMNVTKAQYTGVTIDEYWKKRKGELDSLVDKIDIDGNKQSSLKEIEINKDEKLENVKWAKSFEYSYAFGGVEYHVFQVFVVEGRDGFVFTYTATENNYSLHLDEAKQTLKKAEF